MSDDIAIKVENLTKIYKLYDSPLDRLKESLHPLRKKYHKDFYALNDVSFEIRKGETFGVVGYNGAGKSTLLKIITGVLNPTYGKVEVNGVVSALLELGTGFNPELSGYENIFFNGTVLGFTRAEIENKLDSVLTFADIGEFIQQPVKTYSSGMFVRLAFAVSVMMEPQILILDEALAVGDIFFQQKCYKRLEELKENGVVVMLVSHNMGDIMQFCQRALVLNKGQNYFGGDAREAVKKFFLLQQQDTHPSPLVDVALDGCSFRESQLPYFWPKKSAYIDVSKAKIAADGQAECTAVALCDEDGAPCHAFSPGATAYFYYEFELKTDIEIPVGGVIICNHRNIIVHGRNTLEYPTDAPLSVRKGERIRFSQRILLNIGPGEYTFNVGLSCLSRSDAARRDKMAHSDLLLCLKRLCHVDAVYSFCIAGFSADCSSENYHHGICNLPGDANIYLQT